MLAISIAFASPAGAVLCALALVPLCALALALRSSRRAARAIGLEPPRASVALWAALAAPVACVLVGLAAAQPVLRTTDERRVRTASEVMFVIDVSRSMAAARSPESASRLERARVAVTRLRAAVPEVPAGISSLTDRVLPLVFATPDPGVFAEALRRSVALQAPPPQELANVATSFAALPALARDGFFSPRAARRTCVLVTDGESAPFSAGGVGGALRGPRGCEALIVQVWSPGERVFRADGIPEANYRPAGDARSNVDRLAAAAGGSAFADDKLGAAAEALRSAAVAGPAGRSTTVSAEEPLAAVLAFLALLLVAGLAGARLVTRGWRKETPVYHWTSAP